MLSLIYLHLCTSHTAQKMTSIVTIKNNQSQLFMISVSILASTKSTTAHREMSLLSSNYPAGHCPHVTGQKISAHLVLQVPTLEFVWYVQNSEKEVICRDRLNGFQNICRSFEVLYISLLMTQIWWKYEETPPSKSNLKTFNTKCVVFFNFCYFLVCLFFN